MNPVMVKLIDAAREKVIEEVLGKVAGSTALAGMLALEYFEYKIEERSEALRERAGAALDGCPHLVICKARYSRQGEMANMVMRLKGCAFIYEGVLLWHPTYNLNVGKLVTRVLRYSARNGDVGYYHYPPSRCTVCHPAKAMPEAKPAHATTPPALNVRVTVGRF